MRIKVVFAVNGATQPPHWYTCKSASRQLFDSGFNLQFVDGRDEEGRKVIGAQYRSGDVVITYDED